MIRLPNGKITIARGPDGAPVGVLDVARGRSCGCFCPVCGQPVLARVGPERAGHFSHAPGTSFCSGMGAWHEMVRDVMHKLPAIDLGRSPPVPRLAGVQKIVRASRETAILDKLFRPDVILELQAGVKIAVEVVDTHDVAPLKLAALLQDNWLVLRIDVAHLKVLFQGRIRFELPQLLRQFGTWQSWPWIEQGCDQLELPIQYRSFWLQTIRLISSPNSGQLVRGNHPH